MTRVGWSLLLAVALCSGRMVLAQQAPGPDPEGPAREAEDAATELKLTRIFASLRLSPGQAGQLVPVLEQARARLDEVDEEERAALARLRSAAEALRDDLLTRDVPPNSVEKQYAETVQRFAATRKRKRADNVALLRAQLARTLSRQQLAELQLAAEAERLSEAERSAVAAYGGATGGEAGSSWMTRSLDYARTVEPDRWAEERILLAGKLAGIPRTVPGGPGGPRTPAVQAQIAPYLALLDRARSMGEDEYLQSRSSLGLQLAAQRAKTDAATRAEASALLDAFLDTLLSHPAAVRAASRRAGSGSAGS